MKRGFDSNRDLSKFGSCLAMEGYDFVGRYYNKNNPSKNLSFAEANFLSSIGLRIVAIWENGFPTSASYFSYRTGLADGTAAYEYAKTTISQPILSPIYFAVDYDASPQDVAGVISEYFNGVVSAFNPMGNGSPEYFIGVYGSGLVCRKMLETGIATHSWLAQSTSWRESNTFANYNIKQFMPKAECIDLGAITGDPNECPNDNEGGFQVTHLIDHIVRKNLVTPPSKADAFNFSPIATAPLSLDKIKEKVKANNNSPFTDFLIISLCWLESSFIPDAKNSASSATGLMMMTSPAIDTVNANTPSGVHFEHSEMTNPDKALAAGSWYLKIIFEHSGGGDKKKTLRAYGDGSESYADKIITSENCMQGSTDHMACLKQIHPFV